MFYIYDTKEKRTATRTIWSIRCNAERVCQVMNIKYEGVEEADKPANERRFIIKEAWEWQGLEENTDVVIVEVCLIMMNCKG